MSITDDPLFNDYKKRCEEKGIKPSLRGKNGYIKWSANVINAKKKHSSENKNIEIFR